MHVCDGTKGLAPPWQNTVSTNISACIVAAPDMSTLTAQTNPKRARTAANNDRLPKYMRPFYWEGDVDGIS
jgi:hypothetical protein